MSVSSFPAPPTTLPPASSPRLRRLAVAFAGAAALVSSAACASAAPYNPESLRSDQLSRVEGICQSVVGLSPSEPLSLVWGGATNPGLTGGENHYQGCIASLSASLQSVDSAETAWRADRDCRARGMKPDSPDLAQCVLQSINDGSASAAPPAEPVSATTIRPTRSFFTASNRDVRGREQRACAALGLNPAYGAFGACVKNLSDTFDSIDNPRN